MSKKIIIFVIAIAFSIAAIGQLPVKIISPDKTLEVSITLAKGQISYIVKREGKSIIEPSLLGIEMEKENFSSNLKLIKVSKANFS